MEIVKIGRFAQILGRKASKNYLSNGVTFPFLEMPEYVKMILRGSAVFWTACTIGAA